MNKKLICIGIISMFLLTSITALSAVGMNASVSEENIDEKEKNQVNIERIHLDIEGGIWYTIIIENTGLTTLHLKELNVTVKRGNRILDEWTSEYIENYNELEPGHKQEVVPYLQRINFGVGPIEITAELSGYDFIDASVTRKGFATGGIIILSHTHTKSVVIVPPLARLLLSLPAFNKILNT